MLKAFFDFDGFDQTGDMMWQYYRCVLSRPMGRFYAGDIIQAVSVSFEDGIMQFFDDNNNVIESFNLTLSIVSLAQSLHDINNSERVEKLKEEINFLKGLK